MALIECYRGVVHPWLCDVMGHFSTRHYAAVFDDASYHLLAAIGFAPDHIREGLGFADVTSTITYKEELRAGDLFIVYGRMTRVGGKSLTARYLLRRLDCEASIAEMETVTVQFDLSARRAIPLAPDLRARAQALLADSRG